MVEPVRSGIISRLDLVGIGNTIIKMDFKRTLKSHRSSLTDDLGFQSFSSTLEFTIHTLFYKYKNHILK